MTEGLAGLLAARPEPMLAVKKSKWLADFSTIPDDAAPPLAMSGPHPRATGSYGPQCIAWAKSEMGITLRWWQALAITRQLEHDKDGVLVWREIVDSGPRRIGKSVRLRVVALWRLANAHLFNEPQLAMLVSKDLAVGKEIHRGSWKWAEGRDWNVLRLGGAQEVESPAGDRWLLRAPNACYGYDVGYGQVDESWGVDPTAITDGLEPALLERHSPQLHLTSTAHVKASSLMRRRLVAALKMVDPDVLLLLWGLPVDADIADESAWRLSSPHWSDARLELMRRKYAAALAGEDEPEFDDPDPVRGWAAQYLNKWPLLAENSTQVSVMPNWSLCATRDMPPKVSAIAVAVDPERVWVSIGACSSGKVPYLGAVHRRRLDRDREFILTELVRMQQEHSCAIALDRKGPASSLEADLVNLGATMTPASLDDYVSGCADLFDAVAAANVRHGDHPDLNDAVAAASKRKVGERWAWARNGGDVSMLEAVTLAMWAADETTSVYETRDVGVL